VGLDLGGLAWGGLGLGGGGMGLEGGVLGLGGGGLALGVGVGLAWGRLALVGLACRGLDRRSGRALRRRLALGGRGLARGALGLGGGGLALGGLAWRGRALGRRALGGLLDGLSGVLLAALFFAITIFWRVLARDLLGDHGLGR
jgi:hypothetical protein